MVEIEETNIKVGVAEPMEIRESIKLIKNTRGYNWEIKLHFDKSVPELARIVDDRTLERLKRIDQELTDTYGAEE